MLLNAGVILDKRPIKRMSHIEIQEQSRRKILEWEYDRAHESNLHHNTF